MKISERFIQQLQEKVDIETVISSYVNLKRRGKTFVGLCPFHNEKTPSFTVYPETQSFYCFGCGAGGDVISFVRRTENLDYVEAVKSVAQMAGMSMPEDGFDDTLSKKRARILSANREAARFYHKCLKSELGRQALDYFHSRMLTDKTIVKFGLGYAPDSWDSLIRHMKSLGYTELELYEANLARRSDKNGRVSYYDNFRNRAMFPIIDLRGNVIAFGGRVLDDSKPKYVNTSDTLVYKKSMGVYALNTAKNSNEGKLILVEGYMDVIALHQAGFENAIACLGTAFTAEQANLLSRYADEIYICYDSDEAGQTATRKALSVLGTTGLKLRVIKLSGGKDPDEIIRINGPERFRDLIEGASNRIEYALLRERGKFDIATDDGKMNFLNAASEILAACGEIERDIYAGRLSEETGVSKEAILTRVKSKGNAIKRREQEGKRIEQQKMLFSAKDKNNPEREHNIKAARAEEIIIASLARNPDFYKKLEGKLTPDLFVTSFNKRLFTALCEKIKENSGLELSFFADEFNPQEMDSVTRIFHSGVQLSNTLKECEDCIEVLKSCSGGEKPKASELSDDEFLKLFKK